LALIAIDITGVKTTRWGYFTKTTLSAASDLGSEESDIKQRVPVMKSGRQFLGSPDISTNDLAVHGSHLQLDVSNVNCHPHTSITHVTFNQINIKTENIPTEKVAGEQSARQTTLS